MIKSTFVPRSLALIMGLFVTTRRVTEWTSIRWGDLSDADGGGKIMKDGKELALENVGEEGNPYVIEHKDMLKGILSGEVLNEGENVALSTACAIIGRISAYTGRTVRMSDIIENKDSEFYNMACKPSAIEFEGSADVGLPAENTAAVPGIDDPRFA